MRGLSPACLVPGVVWLGAVWGALPSNKIASQAGFETRPAQGAITADSPVWQGFGNQLGGEELSTERNHLCQNQY